MSQDIFVVVRGDGDDTFYDWRMAGETPRQADLMWRAHVATSYMTQEQRAARPDCGTFDTEVIVQRYKMQRIAHVRIEEVPMERAVGR